MTIKHRVEEGIIVFLILINIFDFMKILPADILFMKEIISWILLGYLLYHISITKQIFGNQRRHVDIALILIYFLLISKNLIHFAEEVAGKGAVLTEFYLFITSNKMFFSYWSFYMGCALIIAMSIYLTFTLHVHKPSLIHVLHEEGIPKTWKKRSERFVAIFLILNGFFLFVFNLIMEWLAIAVHASLIVLAIVFYLFTAFKRHSKKFNADSFIYKVGDFGDKFYGGFISLFHSKRRVFLGLSGILTLHLLTDIANFIVPYVFGIEGLVYLPHFDATHMPLLKLFLSDIAMLNSFQIISFALIYILNILALFLLLFLPSYVWYNIYKRSGFKVGNIALTLFFVSLLIFSVAPVFVLKPIESNTSIGVDIQTSSLADSNLLFPFLAFFLLGGAIYSACFNHSTKEGLLFVGTIIVDIFFGFYIYHFFIGSIKYYWHTIESLLGSTHLFVPLYLLVFLVLTSGFYILGFLVFLLETKKEFKYVK